MTQTRKWTLATTVLAVLVLVAGWFLLIAPEHSKAAEVRSQTAEQQSTNSTLQTKLQMLKSQAEGLPAQQRALSRLTAALPSDPRLPDLVRTLTSRAGTAGVDLVQISPGQPEDVVDATSSATTSGTTGTTGSDTTGGQSTDTSAAAGSVNGLKAVPLTLAVSGDYAQLVRFVNLLEGLNRPLLVTGFTLGPNDDQSGEATTTSTGATDSVGKGLEKITITARTFMIDKTAAAASTTGADTSGSTTTDTQSGSAQ